MNKRREKRYELIHTLRVVHQESRELLGVLINLNSTGMMLLAEHAVPVQLKVPVRMYLPQNVTVSEHIDLVVEVRWCAHHIDNKYRVGMHFVDTNDETEAKIAELVERFPHIQTSKHQLEDPSLHRIDDGDIV